MELEPFNRPASRIRTPPREIGFLAAYGAPMEALLHAAEIAEAIGVAPDFALLGEGLAQEEFFYRALANRVGAPFHIGPVALDNASSPARAIKLGIAYLAPLGAPYRAIAAPRGEALRLLLDAVDHGRAISGLAITSPRRLGALVRVERGREIASLAALSLERIDPALCARGEMRVSQTLCAGGFGFGMILLAIFAPGVERFVLSALLWALFSAMICLRFACAIAADVAPPPPPLADVDLPVYTVIVAMFREGAVIPKLIAGLNAFDYPGIMAQPPQEVNPRPPYIPGHGRDTHSHHAPRQAR